MIICSKCPREATFNHPKRLCNYHWADWWAYGEAEQRDEALAYIHKTYGKEADE